jgi:hypothetical protein
LTPNAAAVGGDDNAGLFAIDERHQGESERQQLFGQFEKIFHCGFLG